jgi:hypothetical protein
VGDVKLKNDELLYFPPPLLLLLLFPVLVFVSLALGSFSEE